MVIAKHLEEIVQHEERGQIERLDVLELDQQLQKALPNSQAPIEEKRPELADVGEQNFVDQPILQQFDESLRFIRTYQSVRGDTIRGLPRARRASDAWSRAPESSTSHENGLELVFDGIRVPCFAGSEGEAINEQDCCVTTHNGIGNRQGAEQNGLVELGEAIPELFVLSVVDEGAHEEF